VIKEVAGAIGHGDAFTGPGRAWRGPRATR
jgi:hypothetical protein